MYKNEHNLVRRFVQGLRSAKSPWGNVGVSCEFGYERGRADVLALSEDGNHLIAFEVKLKKWREALHQAYRNTCFAHSSYVVVPRGTAETAQKYGGEFEKRKVGLCYVDYNSIVVVYEAEEQLPLEPWLFAEAEAAIRNDSRGAGRPGKHCAQDMPRSRHAVSAA